MRAHLAYLWYVLRHKYFVFLECCKLGIPWLGVIHDLSKFRWSEWLPYVRWFYGKRLEVAKVVVAETAPYKFGQCIHYDGEVYAVAAKSGYYLGLVPWEWKEALDAAWNHHQKCNKHHWQYYILVTDDGKEEKLPMPDKYRREMLADWRSISGINANVGDARLHPDTHKWIEEQLS